MKQTEGRRYTRGTEGILSRISLRGEIESKVSHWLEVLQEEYEENDDEKEHRGRRRQSSFILILTLFKILFRTTNSSTTEAIIRQRRRKRDKNHWRNLYLQSWVKGVILFLSREDEFDPCTNRGERRRRRRRKDCQDVRTVWTVVLSPSQVLPAVTVICMWVSCLDSRWLFCQILVSSLFFSKILLHCFSPSDDNHYPKSKRYLT